MKTDKAPILARLRELEQQATKGPWDIERFGSYANVMGPDAHVVYDGPDAEATGDLRGASSLANATFIAEIRNHAAALLNLAETVSGVDLKCLVYGDQDLTCIEYKADSEEAGFAFGDVMCDNCQIYAAYQALAGGAETGDTGGVE